MCGALLSAVLCLALPLVVGAPVLALSSEAAFVDAAASTELLLVAFGAPWCSYCRALSPILDDAERLIAASNLTPVVIAQVDCDLVPRSCAEHLPAKQRYPTVVLFHRGRHVLTHAGRRDAEEIADFVASHREVSALRGVLPPSVRQVLSSLREPALFNSVSGLVIAASSAQALLCFSTALAAFGAVWCTWLVAGFFFGTTLPSAVAVVLVTLVAAGLGRRQVVLATRIGGGAHSPLETEAGAQVATAAATPAPRAATSGDTIWGVSGALPAAVHAEPEPEPEPELEP